MRTVRRRRAAVAVGVLACVGALLTGVGALGTGAAATVAPPACEPGAPAPRTVAEVTVAGVPAWLEGLAVDARGRAFVTTPYTGQVFRIDAPGATPKALTPPRLPLDPAAITGGLLFTSDGRLLGVTGVLPPASLLPLGRVVEIDPDTGAVSTLARGILGGNGIAEGSDGSLYVTSSLVGSIERIGPGGRISHFWSSMVAPNGIAASRDGSHLYVAQMLSLTGNAIRRVDVATGRAHEWLRLPAGSGVPVPDGLTTDPEGRLVLATGLAGQLWRIDPATKDICTLEPGTWTPATQAAYGRGGTGFRAGRLYRVGETGKVQEVPAGAVR